MRRTYVEFFLLCASASPRETPLFGFGSAAPRLRGKLPFSVAAPPRYENLRKSACKGPRKMGRRRFAKRQWPDGIYSAPGSCTPQTRGKGRPLTPTPDPGAPTLQKKRFKNPFDPSACPYMVLARSGNRAEKRETKKSQGFQKIPLTIRNETLH